MLQIAPEHSLTEPCDMCDETQRVFFRPRSVRGVGNLRRVCSILRITKAVASTLALAMMAAMLAACGDRGVVSSAVPAQTRQGFGVVPSPRSAVRTPQLTEENPNDPGWCSDPWICGAGTAPTGGGNGGGGGGNGSGTSVALLPPAQGLACKGSDGVGLVLDSNLPNGATGTSSDIINIWYMYENATFNPTTGLGGSTIVGYISLTAGGSYFVTAKGNDPSFFVNLVAALPAVGAGLTAVMQVNAGVTSPALTPTQINQVFAKYPPGSKSGNGSGACFTAPLPASQWT